MTNKNNKETIDKQDLTDNTPTEKVKDPVQKITKIILIIAAILF